MNGKLKEIGSYEELMAKEGGHFRRLQAFQNMDDAPVEPEHEKTETEKSKEHIEQLKEKKRLEKEEEEKEMKELDALAKDKKKRNASRARELARGSESFFVIGAIGGLLAGSMFPGKGS